MNRTRWKAGLIGGLLSFGALAGCQKQVFLDPADLQGAVQHAHLAKLETQAVDTCRSGLASSGRSPATVLDPTRPARPLTLKEAIAIALEQGTEGSQALTGQANNLLPRSSARGGSSDIDTIAAFALNPAIAEAEIERSLSKFDARWLTQMTWNKIDQPTLSLQQSFSNGDSATFNTTLAKPLPTGGVAGITFSTQYQSLAQPPANPSFVTLPTSYTPRLQFVFEQPLLQGFGVEINQLLPSHPGSFLVPGLRPSGGQGSEGILVTRIRSIQARADFCRTINNSLLNVERAYWNLYFSYYFLAAQEEGLKRSLDGYLYFRERVRIGSDRPQIEYQYLAEFELFRARVVQARGQVLDAEFNLRGILGMRSDDGTRLVPVDDPTMTPFLPDYTVLADEALQLRPELTIARQEVKARQLDLILQRNLRRPDLRFLANYDISGLGATLEGNGPNQNALRSLVDNNFNSWQLGFRLDMPIGFRDANALTRQAQLNLWRSYYQLNDAERKTLEFLTEQYRAVLQTYEVIKARRAQRVALERFVELENRRREAGAFTGDEIANIIRSQRDLADAIAEEFRAIADYNNALAGLEYAKGTIQQYNNVTVAEGPLPPMVQKKAADHFREREAALKVREHPADMPLPALCDWQPTPNIDSPIDGNLPATPPGSGGPAVPMAQPLYSPGTGVPAPAAPPAPAPTPMPNTAPMPQTPETTAPPRTAAGTPAPVAWTPSGPPAQPTAPGATFTPIGTVQLPRRGDTFKPAPEPTTPAPAAAPTPPANLGPAARAEPFPAATNR